MNILVVDDHRLIANDIVREVMELRPDVDCQAIYSSMEALELSKQKEFDLAILDIDMPEMDGLTLARKMQEVQPSINIIFATGYPEYALEAYDIYASAFLVKPVSSAALEKALNNLRRPVLSEDLAEDYYQGGSKLGEKMKSRRMERNLSVKDVADSMGVSPQAVYRWENGERMPDIVTFLSLAKLYRVNIEQMLKD